jgi:hypothetical protein
MERMVPGKLFPFYILHVDIAPVVLHKLQEPLSICYFLHADIIHWPYKSVRHIFCPALFYLDGPDGPSMASPAGGLTMNYLDSRIKR